MKFSDEQIKYVLGIIEHTLRKYPVEEEEDKLNEERDELLRISEGRRNDF